MVSLWPEVVTTFTKLKDNGYNPKSQDVHKIPVTFIYGEKSQTKNNGLMEHYQLSLFNDKNCADLFNKYK